MDFFATCPTGFEELLADELHFLGADRVRVLKGQVSFGSSDLACAYRICLWSRLASRVALVLARGEAFDAEALYETTARIPWEDHLPRGATLKVDAHGTNSQLRNTRFVALRTKDAIADRLAERTGAQPITDVDHPDLTVLCRISRDRATIGIDLTGDPLFRRGYETMRGPRSSIPPLRADYAAAMLALGGWYRACRHGEPALACLFSGAGTIAAEAAAEALDRAPGLVRPRWGFEGWAGHSPSTWQALLEEADERAEAGRKNAVRILAADGRPNSESMLHQALRSQGLEVKPVFVSPSELDSSPRRPSDVDLVTCDLSWLAPDDPAREAQALGALTSLLSEVSSAQGLVALSQKGSLDASAVGEPDSAVHTYLGRDEASMVHVEASGLRVTASSVALSDGSTVSVLLPQSEQFVRRLQKMAKQRSRWAKRELVSCYRVYDSDLPDYAVSIDLFHGVNDRGRWLQVSEYAAPKEIDPGLARARLLDVLAVAPRVLDVRPDNVFVRVRSHSRGGSQYADAPREPSREAPYSSRHGKKRGNGPALPPGSHLIEEGGLEFEVNFSSRLDCGIFLDHRDTRAMIREMAKGMRGSKRFLNLFAYTGTATCYAADGGATHTTTVDMSRPSLDWARRNMERNGFVGPGHEYIQADALSWATEQRHSPNRWDLIFCDVPTFSNSSRMRGSWDVQRDHAELIITLSRLLIRGGTCVFSCNLRSFKPDVKTIERAGVTIEDITSKTIPEDFGRNPKVHHCYLVRRT